jgi:hypothetical protein
VNIIKDADVRAAPAPPGETRWQPIATAKKDRTPILVYAEGRTDRLTQAVVYWREEFNDWYTLDLQPFPMVSHWMPRPAAPALTVDDSK